MASVEKLPMLADGYEKLNAELKALREERPKIVDAIEEARAHGDLSENAEYHAAKERQGQVEASIADLEDKVSRAQIVDPTTLSGDRIIFRCRLICGIWKLGEQICVIVSIAVLRKSV